MSRRTVLAVALVVPLALGALISPWASTAPDGLERVAADQGFADRAEPHALRDGPLAEYAVDGVEDERVATGMSGGIGVIVTFVLGTGLFAALRRRRPGFK